MNNESGAKQAKEKNQQVKNNNEDASINSIKDKLNEQVVNLQDKSQVAKEKVSDNLSLVADKVHSSVDQTQEFLDKKTDKINEFAHHTIEKANELGHRAGDILNSSSEYVKNFDVEETKKQIKVKFQDNPGTSLAIAGIFGLLIGLLIGRNNKSR